MAIVAAVDPAELKGRKIGRVLTKLGRVTREQVHEALAIQQTRKAPLGQILVELGYVKASDVAVALAGQAGMAYVDLTKFDISDELKALIPSENIQAYQVVPIEFNATSKRLKIALTAPTGPDIAQAIRSGEVDCGIATRTVALAAGIDFVPLTRERFDLLMRQRDSYRPALQTLLRFLASPRLKTRAAELGGLDAAPAGEIRWAP